ncbi:expressed protein [Phakopsora pachyrhizi]|uniref:Expressed protein n=1 Tax=Phakopsora pachyrhizi TaxID=170000 RepID=A0AAV0BJE9_PHAPC|nr:expressed protein [Phakopsora pachyrhizi]
MFEYRIKFSKKLFLFVISSFITLNFQLLEAKKPVHGLAKIGNSSVTGTKLKPPRRVVPIGILPVVTHTNTPLERVQKAQHHHEFHRNRPQNRDSRLHSS